MKGTNNNLGRSDLAKQFCFYNNNKETDVKKSNLMWFRNVFAWKKNSRKNGNQETESHSVRLVPFKWPANMFQIL